VLTNAMANAEYNSLGDVCEAVPLTWGASDHTAALLITVTGYEVLRSSKLEVE
jgi:predicted fused transcriptional regulator/phosphomethylpyrimidine kinase